MYRSKAQGSIIIMILFSITTLLLIISPLILRTWYMSMITRSRERLYARYYARESLITYARAYAQELYIQKKSIDRIFHITHWPPESTYQFNGSLHIVGDEQRGFTLTLSMSDQEPIKIQV